MDPILAVILTALLAFAAYSDIRTRLLPNWLALLIFLVSVIGVGLDNGWSMLTPNIAHAAAALIVGIVLFALGWIGGGDAKIYAAAAASIPINSALLQLALVAVSMLVIVIFWLVLRQVGKKSSKARGGDFQKVPLGLPIATGSIIAIWAISI